MNKPFTVVVAIISVLAPLPPSQIFAKETTTPSYDPPSFTMEAVFIPSPVKLSIVVVVIPTPTPTPAPTPKPITPTIRELPSRTVQNYTQQTVKVETVDTSSNTKNLARSMVSEAWDSSQWPAFDRIITMESGWRVNAEEPYSHAYGLGQALPASKMAAYGSDYLTNPITQLKFVIGYIKSRYGTPTAALSFHIRMGWY